MKRILITGKGSYIGTNFKTYMKQWPADYQVDELDMIDSTWKEYDFSKYDVVYHVAGLAHKKEIKDNELLYYKINRDLAYETALKAKDSGVKQFVFMSSMSVYGLTHSSQVITSTTICNPNTYYGKSKFEAENLVKTLSCDNFKVCFVRPPMVYGEDAPGNLGKLIKLVKKIHIFPKFINQRSSVSIDKLVSEIRCIIDVNKEGICTPQNEEYMCTYEIIKKKMKEDGVKVYYTKLGNPLIKLLINRVPLISKCFGDLKYGK